VRRLGAVVEAEGAGAGVAAEGEEVELVAVGVLAVGADEGGVGGVHCRVGFVLCLWRFGGVCEGHDGGDGL